MDNNIEHHATTVLVSTIYG